MATVETLASEAAVEALRDGANAVDAAVVAASVLGVTEPFSCGIGGGGFMVIRTSDGSVTTIDHRETAPAAMRPNSFLENGTPLPFNDARYSGRSAGVPGTVRGWDEALSRYGTMSLAEALQPESRSPATVSSSTRPSSARRSRTSTSSTTFPRLARSTSIPTARRATWDRPPEPRPGAGVRADRPSGRQGFYRGAIADAMVEAVRHPPVAPDANHIWRAGVMTMRDVKAYTAPEREPTRVGYRGSTSTAWARRRAAARLTVRR